MSKQENSLLPKLAMGLSVFLALKLVPKLLAWWAKKQGET